MTNFRIILQYCVPQHLLSRAAGMLSDCKWKWFKNWAIRRLIRKYHVNLSEAASDNLDNYDCFNSFFTRHLKPELRPVNQESNVITSPVDGTVYQTGKINNGTLFQAKSFYYSAETLLGGSADRAKPFQNGSFATLYLAPRDYHRVHMPLDGTLRETVYIPGKLFSVNPLTTEHVPNLFARNERLVCLFDTASGPMAVILVGAMLVGQIRTVWSDNPGSKSISARIYPDKNSDLIFLKKGEELGHFRMGSTVIVLFANDKLKTDPAIKTGESVIMGQCIFR